ncbi:MAG: helix-turn-helix domain-containing protein [Planctomycetota bacterium]
MDATLDRNRLDGDHAEPDRLATEPVLAGTSAEAVELAAAVARAQASRTVVVRGGAGSGRLEVARALHDGGADRTAPFVEVRAAALVGSAGVERLVGTKGRPGLLAAANGGSLAIVGVEDLEEELQSLLADVLASGRFLPLGARAEVAFDARAIAITDVEELELVLVPELAYRLNERTVEVPPLARRTEDLGDVADAVLAAAGLRCRLTDAARESLEALPWIGGLDDLAALVRRAAARAAGGDVDAVHLEHERLANAAAGARGEIERAVESAPAIAPASDSLPIGDRSWRSVERALIARVIEESGGNRSRAARVLGFNRSTLYNKLKQYGLESEGRDGEE